MLENITRKMNGLKHFNLLIIKPFEKINKDPTLFRYLNNVIIIIPLPTILPHNEPFQVTTRSKAKLNDQVSGKQTDIKNFAFVFGTENDLETFFNSKTPSIIVADGTHGIARNSKLQLFSICFSIHF